jgi:catechol 2,3-dioxygenase-like lactoylglutathione lyase family enzyme
MPQLTIKTMSPQLLVRDIEHSIKYYTSELGFTLVFFYDSFYAGLQKDGHSIHLKSGTPSPIERENKRNNYDLDIVFSVENIKGLYEELTARPIDFVQPLCERPYGTEFYIADPDGYILAFVEE